MCREGGALRVGDNRSTTDICEAAYEMMRLPQGTRIMLIRQNHEAQRYFSRLLATNP